MQFLSVLFAVWCSFQGLLLVVSSWLFRWAFAFLFLTFFFGVTLLAVGSSLAVFTVVGDFWDKLSSAGLPQRAYHSVGHFPLLKCSKDWSINIESSFSSINTFSHEYNSSFRSSGLIVLVSSTICLIAYAAASQHLAFHRAFASRRSFSAPARARPLSFANDTCCLNSILVSLLFCPFLQSSHSRRTVREEPSNICLSKRSHLRMKLTHMT